MEDLYTYAITTVVFTDRAFNDYVRTDLGTCFSGALVGVVAALSATRAAEMLVIVADRWWERRTFETRLDRWTTFGLATPTELFTGTAVWYVVRAWRRRSRESQWGRYENSGQETEDS